MKFYQRVIFLASIGFGLGAIIGPVITAITGTMAASDGALHLVSDELVASVGNPIAAFIIQAIVSGLYGAVAMGGSAVYSIEEWSLFRCTFTHYILVMVGIYVTGFICRWFGLKDIESLLFMLPFMTVPYIIIWLAIYLSYKTQLKEINAELNNIKSSAGEGA